MTTVPRCPNCGRPTLLDAYCCAGGAAVGYDRAGFCVTGVDIVPRLSYPFRFVQGDAVTYLREHGHEYAARHASPPCQANIAITAGNRKRDGWTDTHVNLIPATREALALYSGPTVIENGKSRHLRADVTLCGLMFPELKVLRDRYFELGGWAAVAPPHPSHKGHRVIGWRHGVKYEGDVYAVYGDGGGKGSVPEWQAAMGIDWTDDRKEIAEAIPPAYTEYLGRQLMTALGIDPISEEAACA